MMELTNFMYGSWKDSPRLKRWWVYVLETKDWVKLREYKEHKINTRAGTDHQPKLLELAKQDKRLTEFGKRKLKTFLKEYYDMEISLSTAQRFLKTIRGTNAN